MSDRKSGWDLVKLGDVVRQVKDKVEPTESGLERYIAGEHMDTDELRIRRWGAINGDYLGPAFHMRFRPGQVLYGSRRTYLRKVAVADFEGITANTTFVVESSDPERLHPELLPFVMSAERFHEHSKKQSKGSVNPYVNFSDLSWYEFGLPPLEEQRGILAKLKAVEGTLDSLFDLESATNGTLAAEGEWWATGGAKPVDEHGFVLAEQLNPGWRLMTIRELCTGGGAGLTLGPFGSSLTVKDYGHLESGTPVLFVADVRRYQLAHVSAKFVSAEKHSELANHEALPGDVLVTEMGWPPGEACVVPEGWPASIIKADIIRARTNPDRILPDYLVLVLNSHWGQQQLVRISPGTTRPRMTLRDFERVRIAVPPIEQQQRAVERCSVLLNAAKDASARRGSTQDLKSKLLSSVWGTE